MDNIREFEGVFYRLDDIDVNGRPYEDAQPVNLLNKETDEELRLRLEKEKKLKIQKAQMADDVHRDKSCDNKSCGSCPCGKFKVLFATNTHEGVKYDSYGFQIKDLL